MTRSIPDNADRPGAELQVQSQSVESIPVTVFEGDVVTDMEGRLPAITIDMAEGYLRNTHLRMEVEVRVKNVRYEEGPRGDLRRVHVFALEAVALKVAFRAEDAAGIVTGSASGQAEQTPEQAVELGLTLGRSGDHWDGGPGF